MTLYKVFSTKKQRQAVLCWHFLLHMARRAPAVSAHRAFQTKKNIKGKIRGGSPEESGRMEETGAGGSLFSRRGGTRDWTGTEKRPPEPTQWPWQVYGDGCAEAGCCTGTQRHHPTCCQVHWVEVTCSRSQGSPSVTCMGSPTPPHLSRGTVLGTHRGTLLSSQHPWERDPQESSGCTNWTLSPDQG